MSLSPKRVGVLKYEIQCHQAKETTIKSDLNEKSCPLADTAAQIFFFDQVGFHGYCGGYKLEGNNPKHNPAARIAMPQL